MVFWKLNINFSERVLVYERQLESGLKFIKHTCGSVVAAEYVVVQAEAAGSVMHPEMVDTRDARVVAAL